MIALLLPLPTSVARRHTNWRLVSAITWLPGTSHPLPPKYLVYEPIVTFGACPDGDPLAAPQRPSSKHSIPIFVYYFLNRASSGNCRAYLSRIRRTSSTMASSLHQVEHPKPASPDHREAIKRAAGEHVRSERTKMIEQHGTVAYRCHQAARKTLKAVTGDCGHPH